jgi:serine/threonine-protein kinase PpkA
MTQRVLHTLDMDSTIKIPGYRIESKIGEGGMATVYLAEDALERPVALKIMAPTTLADPSAEERFLKEGKIIAKLSHPNIVTVHTLGRYESMYYMVIEYIKGGNLIARIQQGLTVQNTFDICKQIASALGYAHNRGYIHRDVKPANILFREDGTAVLSDFGIARDVVSPTHLTAMGQAIGTPEYMSPEQITGRPVDARCDLYSLGVVLYEMLTRQKPFKGDTALSTAMCHLRDPVPQLPKPLTYCQPLIERLLAKDPDERFATAEQFIQILEDISAKAARFTESSRTKIKTPRSATVVKSIGKKRSRPHKWLKSKTIAWAAGFGVLVMVVGTAVYYWQMAHYIDPRTRVIINMLLSHAEQLMATSRLIEPAGDNAYQNYLYILEFDPRNKQAREGLKNIADRLEKHALAKQQQDQFEEALALTAQGIKIAPQHEGLRALRKELSQQLEEKWRRREVARLIAKAEQQLAASHLMEPADDNAYQSYRSVLKLDPHNRQALSGIQKIANRIEQLARTNQRQEKYKQGLKMVTQGLLATPKHSGLLTLQKELTQQLEEKRLQREVAQLLAQAERQLKDSHLLNPPDDNAYASYRKVLKVEPGNAEAQAGLDKIAALLARSAAQRRDDGRLQESLTLAERGLRAFPDHAGLQALRAEVRTKIEERERQHQEVQRLLAEAERQLKASHLTQPKHDNAYASYRQVLELEPDNAEAQAGLAQIATRYEQIAREHERASDLQKSLEAIKLGLQVNPGHAGLLALRGEVQAQIEAQARRQREVAQLLTQAEQQLNTSQLIEPADDNAYASYRKVFEVEPGNTKAQAGLEKIAALLERSAAQRRDDGKLQESLTLAERGLRAFPDHRGLQALRAEVRTKIEERERRRQEVQHLLTEAERQLTALHLTQPEHDNAYASYRKVLELDPENTQAKAGLERIAKQFEQLARQRQAEGLFQESLAAAERGLRVLPEHAGLQALRTEVQAQIDAQARQRAEQEQRRREVAQLLVQAERQLKASLLIEPVDNNAYASYRKVLELEPNNAQAKAGLERIAGQFEQSARQRQAEGSFQESLAAIEQGLQVLPEHTGLQALRAQVQAQIDAQARQRAEQERRQRKVTRLLTQAEQQLKDSHLLEPPDDNAYASYRKVLELEPDNAQAKAGLERIAGQFEHSARQRQAEGSFQESLAAIEQGLQVIPGHAGLQALRAQVQAQIDAQARQRAEQERRQHEVARLLVQAEGQLKASQLIEPANDNAYASYRKVLELEPNNGKARQGLQAIAEHFEKQAQRCQNEGRLIAALVAINAGLKAVPDDPNLVKLQQTINQNLNEKARRHRRLSDLEEAAKAHMSASHYIQPDGENAFQTFNEMLTIDPDNRVALEGLDEIVRHYEQSAQEQQRKGNFAQSLSLAEAGLKVQAKNTVLIALRKEAITQLETQRQQRQSDQALEKLLAEADQQLADLYLTTPKGNNAYESYQQVLKISPDNPRALAGIQHIADRYYELGKASLDNGSFEDSLKLIDRGLQVAANHSALLDLKEEVQRKLEEETNRQQALQRLVIEAQQRYRAGDLRHALATIARGLQIEPTHAGLLRLQKEIEKLAGKKRLENEKKRLLAKAQEKLEADQLMQPEGDNAYEIYQKVLELDPKNLQAHKGLQIMTKHYETQARAKQQEGDLNESLSLVGQGLKIDPRHPGLLKLQATLTHQLELEREQKKRDEPPKKQILPFGTF